MVLYFFNAVVPEPVARLALNHSINKVDGFIAEVRNFSLLNYHLFCKNLISDFLSILAVIRSLLKIGILFLKETHTRSRQLQSSQLRKSGFIYTSPQGLVN